MNLAPDWGGVAFSDAADGDLRNDRDARLRFGSRLGISAEWATVSQVHGAKVVHASGPGDLGEADAIWVDTRGLPVAVFTADCLGVILLAEDAVGVAHAGWRGVNAEVVPALRNEMSAAGHEATRAAIGPGIGPCCFEVGDDVSSLFPESVDTTTWGTTSVDLVDALEAQLSDLDRWVSSGCTKHDPGYFSHRENATRQRMAAVGWLT